MIVRSIYSIVFALLISQSATSAHELTKEQSDDLELIAEKLPGLIDRIKALETANAQLNQAVPPGAVVAFDLGGKCPDETWENVTHEERKRFAGRTLVIAGPAVDRGANSTVNRDFDEEGGREKVKLTSDEMQHEHEINTAGNIHGHSNPSAVESSRGDAVFGPRSADHGNLSDYVNRDENTPKLVQLDRAPFDNMPPFIALTFCKKKEVEEQSGE